jgi:hypothetical protein
MRRGGADFGKLIARRLIVAEQVSIEQAKINQKFDWVTERSLCSLPKVFNALRSQIEADVKTRNGLRPELSPYEFSMVESGDTFKVVLEAKGISLAVVFNLREHAIVVLDGKGETMFEVTLTFNDAGECKLNAREQQWEFWQIRRMALEELMFRSN